MADTQNLKQTKKSGRNFRLRPLTACVRAIMAGSTFVMAASAYAELPVPSAAWVSPGGSASRETIGNTLNINQQTDRVILNWDSFNVSADSAVNYKQPRSASIALNRIGQNDPSRIMGTITANGQIYLVNKNGFLFGKDSVVNTQGLVASTLDVTDQVFKDGITKVADIDQRAAFEGSGDFYRKNPDGSFKLDADGNKIPIAVNIEKGASIKAGEGQRILIIAPTIENKGDIEAPGGQVLMAAATDKVYLQEADPAKSDVRGLLIEVKTGGKVTNLGNIVSERGNVTLMGFAVNQKGKVSATTTTSVNGTIRLLAREGAQAQLGPDGGTLLQGTSTTRTTDKDDGLKLSATVTLADGSTTEVLPQREFIGSKETTAIDAQEQPQSRIEMMGHTVHLEGGSEIIAPSGKVEMTATENPVNPVAENTTKNSSRLLIESGAKIDVSGLDSAVKPMESNVVDVELRSFELKDAPLQKTGILKNKTIRVDVRKGTPITDIQPFVDGIQRKLDERMSKGGKIILNSEGDLVTEDKSVLDFSGGAVTYLDGFINTTVLTSNGRFIDISEADPLLTYDGIYGEISKEYKKWGITQTWQIDSPFSLARREAGYVQGSDAGSLVVKGANVVLQGDLLGHAINGRIQRSLSDQAKGGVLSVNNGFSNTLSQAIEFTNALTRINLDIDDLLPEAFAKTLALKANYLFNSGIQAASLESNSAVNIAANTTVGLRDGGSLSLKGGTIDVNGSIQGTGATVALATDTTGGPAGLDGHITLAENAALRLQGEWVNDFAAPGNLAGKTVAIDGGGFSATADGHLHLKKGSQVDVSGGAWVQSSNQIAAGSAGSIVLKSKPETTNNGGNITLDGVLSGYGLGQGGTLAVEANAVALRRQREEDADGIRPLQIDADFFDQGGFSEFVIASNLNGLNVEDGVNINLVQKNRLLNRDFLIRGNNASGIGAFSQVVRLLPEQRSPTKLTLRTDHSAGDISGSGLTVAKTAKITADDLSSITLESDTSLFLNGQITAHGGRVALNITDNKSTLNDPRYVATQGIWLGDTAKIDVSGSSRIVVDALGRRSGKVFDGGDVVVKADRGFFASLENSLIDVSGTQATLDLPQKNPGAFGVSFNPAKIGSDAGTINITTAEGVFIDGQMQAKAGSAPGTAGGTLVVKMDIDNRNDPELARGAPSVFPSSARTLVVGQQKNSVFSSSFKQAGDALPNALNGTALLSGSEISDSGFSSLALAVTGGRDEIRFQGDVSLQLKNSIVLDTSKFVWERKAAGDTGDVRLTAATVQMGSTLYRSALSNAADGDGTLTVKADLIDLTGGAATSGFNTVNLQAGDDIRLQGLRVSSDDSDFAGEFKTYSKLNLTADQVYPTTLSRYTLAVTGDPAGKITFNQGGASAPVFSALSKLTVKAPTIEQNGTVKAPFGEIVFDAADSIKLGSNSVTSVSAEGLLIPLGITQGNLEWLFPLAGSDRNLIIEAPQKKVSFKADKILRDDGALIDLSGGGDLLAYEFIPGAGGSADVLDSNQIFAVLPGLKNYAPVDPIVSPKSGLKAGDNIYISAGSGLAAGEYVLLPARYAVLPGAFLVSPQPVSVAVIPGSKRSRVDGAPVVSGFRTVAGTGIRDQLWSEFAIEPGSIASTRSEYNMDLASVFFAERALRNEQTVPRLPQDAGQLVLDAKSQLELPVVRANAANNALGGLVDIVSDNLSVVTSKSGLAGQVELLAGDIDQLNVGSLLMGAVRSFDDATGSIRLDVKTKSVTIAGDTTVKAPEILLAATDKIELKRGSRIQAEGEATGSGEDLEISGDGALLRASTGKQATIKRAGSQGLKGDLIVGDDAVIAAGTGSVILDSTRSAKMAGELELAGGSLNIGAEAINIGETAGVTSGLSLDNSQLTRLTVKELVLTSRSTVNIYGQTVKADANGIPLLDEQGNFIPLEFGSLVIDSEGLSGQQNAGKTALLNAKTVTLANNGVDISSSVGSGTGALTVNAGQLLLDKGNYQLSGFNQVTFNLTDSITGIAEGRLTSLANVSFNTPFISAESGAKTTIDATGHALLLDKASQAAAAAGKGIGAELNLIADNVALNTVIDYKAGNVSIEALQGDVLLGSNAVIDVSGAVINAGLSKPVNLQAGNINLLSQKQNVQAESGSKLLLKGDNANMAAGMLTAGAARGEIVLNGFIDAHSVADAKGGRVAIDTGSLAGGFAGLNSLFTVAGVTGGIDVRLRNGDINVDASQIITADAIKLTADSGKITVAGTLDARDANGGEITVASEDQLTLESTAKLLAGANGNNGAGGQVMLSSIERDADGAGIEIKNGARIDVSASGNGAGGDVRLRADRTDTDADGIADINIKTVTPGAITGDSSVAVQAVKIYSDTRIDGSDQDAIDADNQAYIAGVSAGNVAAARFGAGYQILPEDEVRSGGDLTIAGTWDFAARRHGVDNVPGILTLRAAKDVLIEGNLSDGFAPGQIDLGEFGIANVDDFLQSGPSWSYNISAGSDLNSADSMATIAGIGDVKLANDAKIRTGTGDINIHAGRDIVYGNNNAVIYTAGRPDDVNRWGFSPVIAGGLFYAEYPLDGGDISLTAGRDITGKPTQQLTTDWLVRTGNWSRNDTHDGERPAAWGIAFGSSDFTGLSFQHQQSVAALGGGNIDIVAGRNIADLSVVIPTTGKQVGQEDPSETQTDNFDYLNNLVEVNGGGNLQLAAGGDIAGGVFHVDGGTANVKAGGSLKAGSNKDSKNQGLSPVLAMGDSQFNIIAGHDIALEAVIDPMIVPQLQPADAAGISSLFFRYSPDSSLTLTSKAGDIVLKNDAAAIEEATNANITLLGNATANSVKIYPASLKSFALNGNIKFENSLDMYPSKSGDLELYAADNITGNGIVHLSDADPEQLPNVEHPAENFSAVNDRLNPTGLAKFTHAVEPLHAGDENPVLISTGRGNIGGANDNLAFALAKPALLQAGNDIRNVNINIQHNKSGDNTLINALRDVKFNINYDPFTGIPRPIQQVIKISGPGQLTVLAGRHIDLGASDGILTIGNQFNPALADDGANITAVAGLAGGRIDVSGFAEKIMAGNGRYVSENQSYLEQVTAEMRAFSNNPSLTAEAALALFDNLPAVEKARFEAKLLDRVEDVFFKELNLLGNKLANAGTKQDQQLAELQLLATIETLLPGTTLLAGNNDYSVSGANGVTVNGNINAGALLDAINNARTGRPKLGDISLFFSTIQTLDGGGINLMAPNGGINAGLAASFSAGDKSPVDDPEKFGIIVQKQGDINGVVRDNFAVNIARVMTLGGGNIMAGSTEGNIDAGRSPKTALSAPAPKVTFDAQGNPIIEFAPVLAGGGIRTISPPGTVAGDILLFAPRGIIDAGEAGIGGNNITLSASAIVGADNIDVGGVSVGVPVAATGSIAAGLTGVSNLAASVTNAVASSTNIGKDASESQADRSVLGTLIVDILGFGD